MVFLIIVYSIFSNSILQCYGAFDTITHNKNDKYQICVNIAVDYYSVGDFDGKFTLIWIIFRDNTFSEH